MKAIRAHFSRLGKGQGSPRPTAEVRVYLSENGRLGAIARTLNMTAEQRSKQARKASLIRWAKR